MSLPESLRAFFWDLEFERLHPERDRSIIVPRIAEHGTDDAIRWLRATYRDDEIAAALEAGCHRVSRRTLNLWALWLKKPEEWCKIPSRPLKGVFWKS